MLFRTVVSIACLTLTAFAAGAQTNPEYVGEMPSIDRVKTEIKGTDETDTLARQIAVLTYLPQILDRIRVHRGYSAPFSPDEQRVSGAYQVAAYQLTQAYNKTHTPKEADAFGHLEGHYEFDSAFHDDWYRRLMSPLVRSVYETGQSAENARAKAHFDAERQQGSGAPVQPSPSGTQAGSGQARAATHSSIGIFGDAVDAASNASILDNDPQSKAARRCLELGGTKGQCLGDAAASSIMDIMQAIAPSLTKSSTPAFAGLRMGGTYRSDNALVLNFGNALTLEGCGRLVPDGHNYTVSRRGSDTVIDVEMDPHPLHLALGSTGQISGPGPIDITGRIITGYQIYNVQKRYRDGTIVPGSAHQEQVPVYAPRTERCILGAFRPVPAPIADNSSPGLFSMFLGDEQSEQSKLTQQHPTPAGLRMAGIYAGPSGLRFDFGPTVVVLDCGEAHTLATYSVRNSPERAVITIDNRGGSFTLTLQPDNTLAGSGMAAVSGRILIGETRDDFTYRPSHQGCSIGTLQPSAAN
ncbi:MAG TPA: hypothetical protein VHZ28_09310 [Terracidiphilus sp.]|nr:hypothetical protein [Terracidiphilus sp.]